MTGLDRSGGLSLGGLSLGADSTSRTISGGMVEDFVNDFERIPNLEMGLAVATAETLDAPDSAENSTRFGLIVVGSATGTAKWVTVPS
jgi:hypothetical protein